jgi:HD-GYP domain-containing protein (c-di-GMP phosphodiesterase class II)
MAQLCEQVALELGWTRSQAALLRQAVVLHDVGKIGLPDEILRKPSALTEEDWATVREHPLIGERILRTVPGLEAVATAVRHEHERWDGEGYPDGLAGEDIPLASRITLVCDAFHAMTSDRPYRAALPREEALAELTRHAGTQFDPAVVTALIAIEREAAPAPLQPAGA